MIVHLPPPTVWRQAQAQARAQGLWLDLTMDGVYHVYRMEGNIEQAQSTSLAGALALLGRRAA